MGPLNPNADDSNDPLEALAQLARLESAPKTHVTPYVLREIRVQDRFVAGRPLMWLALASSVAALAIAIIAIPILMTLLDPLNALYQTTSASLM
ncbi:MAG: hypothetical protein VCD00_03110 [Candidatus Hydrogenedentota bacterium]